jgi:hypothetical protein
MPCATRATPAAIAHPLTSWAPCPSLLRVQVPLFTGRQWAQARLQPNTLVRYVGLVQDVYDPESFFSTFQQHDLSGAPVGAIKPSAFRDSLPAGATAGGHGGNRLTMVIMPLPGEAAWSRSLREAADGAAVGGGGAGAGRPKRDLEGGLAARGHTDMDTGAGLPSVAASAAAFTAASYGGAVVVKVTAAGAVAAASFVHPLAMGEREAFPCPPVLVRVYGVAACPYRPGDSVEVVGIYTVDSDLYAPGYMGGEAEEEGMGEGGCAPAKRRGGAGAGVGAGVGDADMSGQPPAPLLGVAEALADAFPDEEAAKNPPSSVAPRLHAVLARRLPPGYPVLDAREESVRGVCPWAFTTPQAAGFPTLPADAQMPPLPQLAAGASEAERLTAGKAALVHQTAVAKAKVRSGVAAREAHGGLALARLSALATELSGAQADLRTVRAMIVSALSACVGGDAVAAEWLLLWAHSGTGTYGRRDELDAPLGRTSLCIIGMPDCSSAPRVVPGAVASDGLSPVWDPPCPVSSGASPSASRLHDLLASIAPTTALLPLRLDTLNAVRWFPARDASSRTLPGLLQTGVGTLLVVDETVLTPGKVRAPPQV